MSIDKNPKDPFIQRFGDDLKINGKSPRTQESYCRALRKFIEFLGHSPDQASEDQLRNYLLMVNEQKKWKSSTINVTLQALKLYFRITCPRDWQTLQLARVRVEQKLPVVITIGEVHTLLKIIEKPSMHCFFTVVYALGLRLQEALNLQVADNGAVQPAAGEEVSIGERPDPPLGCNGLLRLGSGLRGGRVTVFVPASSWRFRAAIAME